MGKSINKFIVRLSDQTAFRPQLAVSVVPNKEKKKTFDVRLLNPNTKEVAFSEEFVAKGKDEMTCFVEALSHGKSMLERAEVRIFQYSLEYKEQLFIPQGRRGKMKLKTKDSEEAIAERQAAKERDAEAAANGIDDLPEFVEEDVEVPEEAFEDSDDSTPSIKLKDLIVKKTPKKKKETKPKNKVVAKVTKIAKKKPKTLAKKAKVVAKPTKNKKKVVKKAAPKKKDKNKKKKK